MFLRTATSVFPVLLCTLVLSAGCSYSPQEYSDPLGAFGSGAPRSHLAHLTLGVILSGNFYNSSKYLEDQQAVAQSLGPLLTYQPYVKDVEGQYIHDGTNQILVRRFKNVFPFKDRHAVESSDVDLFVVLDLNVNLGSVAGTKTSVFISGNFMEPRGSFIDTVEGHGVSTVPFPAVTTNVRGAATAALESLAHNLDASEKLQAYAKEAPSRQHQYAAIELPELHGPPINIAVADLSVIEELSGATLQTLTDHLRSALLETGYFTILSRDDMERIIEEHSFQFSGVCSDTQDLVELGRILPAKKIIGGAIGKVGTTYTLTLRFVDIETGEIEHMVDEKVKAEADELLPTIQYAGRLLAKKYAVTME